MGLKNHIKLPVKNNKEPTELSRLTGSLTHSWMGRHKSGEKRTKLCLKFSEKEITLCASTEANVIAKLRECGIEKE